MWFLTSFLINILFLLVFVFCGVVRYGSLDDYFMAVVLNGAYGGAFDPHLYFVNGVIAYMLKPFMVFFPDVGWFYVFEMTTIFVSFGVFSYFIMRRLGGKLGLLVALLVNSLVLEYYSLVSFTQCASLLTAAGLVLSFSGLQEKKNRFLVFAVLLLFLGALLRWQAFLLGLPYIFFLFVLQDNPLKRWNLRIVVAALICVASIFVAQKFDAGLYNDSEYRYYAAYQPKRSFFGDGAHFDKEAIYDELEEREMNGRDFGLLTSWVFYDTQVFCSDSLDKFIGVANRNVFQPEWTKVPLAIWLSVSNAFAKPAAWCWCILCIILFLTVSGRPSFYPWCSVFVVVISYVYLLLLNRLVYHVEMGIWVYALACAIPVLRPVSGPFLEFIGNRKKGFFAISLFVVVCFSVVSLTSHPTPAHTGGLVKTPAIPSDWQLFLEHAEANPNNVFLLTFDRYKELGTFKDKAYKAVAPSSWQNIYPIGYWNIHLPAMKRELEKRGVTNPLHDIVNSNVFVLEMGNQPRFLDFYKRHYQKDLAVDSAYVFGDVVLLKYREIGYEQE